MDAVPMLLAILLPFLGGILVRTMPHFRGNGRDVSFFTGFILILECALVALVCLDGDRAATLLSINGYLPVALRSDDLSKLFSSVAALLFAVSGLYALYYMRHDDERRRFFAYYLMTLGAFIALCYASTLVTMYMFFELMAVLSIVLVLHDRSRDSIRAGVKYAVHSIMGAILGLFGLIFIAPSLMTPYFAIGGSLNAAAPAIPRNELLLLVFIAIVGFSAKAGMFPLHGWLPLAHPVAPAPASAVLSGVITKGGVLCIIRVIYYSVGADALRGTWVQYALLALAVITVFMGSMLALGEDVLKKRLAFSSVSQVSYVLCGVFLMDQMALTGAFLHVLSHALIKAGLFLCAGSIIHQTGRTRVSEMHGMGRRMPVTMWCFLLCSLGLIGIPPFSGFISKWFLAEGAVSGGEYLAVPVFNYLVPAILLISALLTAGYLLPVGLNAFFPSKEEEAIVCEGGKCESGFLIKAPVILLAALMTLLGLFPGWLESFLSGLSRLML